METKIFENLKAFVLREIGQYEFSLTRKTELYKDLRIWGDDADDFIIAFSEKFGVDVSRFDMSKYFKSEGDEILPAIIRLFTGRQNQLIVPITLGDLEQAIVHGKLDDEVITKNKIK